MKVTSYFIGLEIRVEVLADLFERMYEFFDEKSCLDVVEFQNPLSMHVTLYYLDKNIDEGVVKDELRNVEGGFYLDELGSFEGRIYYLTGVSLEGLETEFERYKSLFPNDVFENGLDFVSHVTLFRVVDENRFSQVKEEIVGLMRKYLDKLEGISVSTGKVSLYKVNSNFRPELQLKVK